MKKLILILVCIGFLLISLTEIQAQTTQSKPNQVELMKKLMGNWKAEWTDTTFNWEAKTFGTGFECYYNYKCIAKDKIVMEGKQLWGYSSKLDKFIGVDLLKGREIQIVAMWFTTDNKYILTDFNNISDPDKSFWKIEGEVKSADAFSETWVINGKPMIYDLKRIK